MIEAPEKYKNHPKVIVNTKAKSIRGKLEAIISQHFVCNWPESGDIVLLYKDAVKYILNEFEVKGIENYKEVK